jgi:hypothetical protein
MYVCNGTVYTYLHKHGKLLNLKFNRVGRATTRLNPVLDAVVLLCRVT